MKNLLLPAVLLSLIGCSYSRPMQVAPMALGPKEIPSAIGAGKSRAIYFLGFRVDGEDSLAEAVKNAKEGSHVPHSTMANVFVDRHVFSFPAFWFPLYQEYTTSVYGTIITYKLDEEHK